MEECPEKGKEECKMLNKIIPHRRPVLIYVDSEKFKLLLASVTLMATMVLLKLL